MTNLNQKKPLTSLAIKSMKANKLRNIIIMIAIVLTASLFSILFNVLLGTMDSYQYITMKQAGGDGHLALRSLSDQQYQTIKTHPLIKEISYARLVADGLENPEISNNNVYLIYKDRVGLAFSFHQLKAGKWPQAIDEIALDTKTAELLNIKAEVGEKVALKVRLNNQVTEKEFVISGYWQADKSSYSSGIYVSDQYLEQYLQEIKPFHKIDVYRKGVVATIKCDNQFNLQEKLNTIITESGFSVDANDGENFVDGVVKWSNISESVQLDIKTFLGLAAFILLLIFTGYLLIYNIFQISVVRDIKSYGLLKIIGVSNQQIKKIISIQALILTIIALPIGLLLGTVIGRSIVPLIIEKFSKISIDFAVPFSPLTLVFTVIFVAFTVWISIFKPRKFIESIPAIESYRYEEVYHHNSTNQNAKQGKSDIKSLSIANLLRSRRQFIIVIISLSLCLVLLNSVVTISNSFNLDKYLDKFVDTDFYIANAEYFKYGRSGAIPPLEPELIEWLETDPSFESGGKIYCNDDNIYFMDMDSEMLTAIQGKESNHQVAPTVNICSHDDYLLERLKVLSGSLDVEKYKSGDYIIQVISVDELGVAEDSMLKVGDKVTIKLMADDYETVIKQKEYTILAQVELNNSSYNRAYLPYKFYLPEREYMDFSDDQTVISYKLNVQAGQEDVFATRLEDYLKQSYHNVEFESKAKFVEDFGEVKTLFSLIGFILAAIIGIIGLINLMNTIVTSIITRNHEFTLMEAIGMTRKQIRKMLFFEAVGYSLATIVFSFIFALLLSLTALRFILNSIWFMEYKMAIMPLFYSYPIIFIIALLVPMLAIRDTFKESTSERLAKIQF